MEALACNKPVLISNKINIWREIEKGLGGIVKNDTQEDTYNLLKQWFLLGENEKEGMALAAHDVYRTCFTMERAAEQFINGINN